MAKLHVPTFCAAYRSNWKEQFEGQDQMLISPLL